jgi:hypothetical protein
MDKITIILISIIVLLLLGSLITQSKKEKFTNEEPKKNNPFPIPLGMNRYKSVKDGECCDVWPVGDIISATCNRLPVFPRGLTPNKVIPDKIPENKSEIVDDIVDREGTYTFKIPELKYDGIWSQKDGKNGKCCWSLKSNKLFGTYGGDKLSPVPECSLFGKTIISPPECAGLSKTYEPPITFVYDCHENIPCEVRDKIIRV